MSTEPSHTQLFLNPVRRERIEKITKENNHGLQLFSPYNISQEVFIKIYKEGIVILYVSTPVKAIVGGFQFSHVIEENLSSLWNIVKDIAGVTFEQFSNYYSGADNGYGVFISRVSKYSTPLSLELLRNSLANFSPPQNFCYLHSTRAVNLNLLDFEVSNHLSQDFSIHPPPISTLV